MTRGDRIVIAAVALTALLAWPATLLAAQSRAESVVVTSLSGKSVVALRPDRDVVVDGAIGPVTLRVRDGALRVVDAPCPDGVCMRQGSVPGSASAIVCVPSGISVTAGGDTGGLDAVVR